MARSKLAGAPHAGFDALQSAVEDERLALMKVEAILGCLNRAMESEPGGRTRGPYYPLVVELARDLVTQSIARLDSVHTRGGNARKFAG